MTFEEFRAEAEKRIYTDQDGEFWQFGDLCTHREADVLMRANWRAIKDALGEGVEIARELNGAVGWADYILIPRGNDELLRKAYDLTMKLEEYPILDEHIHGEEELEEYVECWEGYAKSDFESQHEKEQYEAGKEWVGLTEEEENLLQEVWVNLCHDYGEAPCWENAYPNLKEAYECLQVEA